MLNQGIYIGDRDRGGYKMTNEVLSRTDLEIINNLQEKNIKTDGLRNIFSKINNNPRFQENEKEYLKQILVANINNAFKKKYS